MHIPNTISAFVLAFDLYLFPTTKTDSAKAKVNVIISLLFSHIAVRIANAIADELKTMDVTTFTPIEAMNKLFELSQKAKEI